MTRFSMMLALVAGGLVACDGQNAVEGDAQTGAKLSLDYFADTDVVGFRFEVTQLTDASCDPYATKNVVLEGGKNLHFDVDLVDGLFPGGIVDVLNASKFKDESRHIGADLFVSLPEGCYLVDATPVAEFGTTPEFGDAGDNTINDALMDPEFGFDLNKDKNDGDFYPSEDCAAVWGKTAVKDGKTSEILLLSQCDNDPIGALGALVLLNHPPEMLVWIDERFGYECEAIHVCALVKDPDDDPVRTEIRLKAGDASGIFNTPEMSEPKLVNFTNGSRDWISCAEITADTRGEYTYEITAWDVSWKHGAMVDIEDLVDANQGLPSGTTVSQDRQHFPLRWGFYETPQCLDDNGDVVDAPGVDVDFEKGCYPSTNPSWYYCEDPYASQAILDIRDFICDGNTLVLENLLPTCGMDWIDPLK